MFANPRREAGIGLRRRSSPINYYDQTRVAPRYKQLGRFDVGLSGIGDPVYVLLTFWQAYLARCCNPLPGEPIIGDINITRGNVAVHSANCPNVRNLIFNADREIGVEWADARQSQFQVELEIVMEDRQGILARIVSAIANLKTNIRQMETRSADGKASVELVLEIADLKHLEKVTRSLSSVDGVMRVDRKYNIRHATA